MMVGVDAIPRVYGRSEFASCHPLMLQGRQVCPGLRLLLARRLAARQRRTPAAAAASARAEVLAAALYTAIRMACLASTLE